MPARVAWSPTLGYAEPDAEVLAACERAVALMASLGADVVEVDRCSTWTRWARGSPTWPPASCGRWSPTATTPPGRASNPLLAAVVDHARSTTARDLVEAIDECHRLNLALVGLFHEVRLLVTPTTAAAAPPLSLNGSGVVNGEVTPNWVRYTYPFNMTRSPAASVCAGLTSDGLPVGLQLVGPQHGDLVVLRSAAALEAALGFDELAPVGGD